MSQYRAKTEDGKMLLYGFDRPLQEYFLTVFDNGNPVEMFNDRNDIAQFLCDNEYTLPREHLMAMMLDVPF